MNTPAHLIMGVAFFGKPLRPAVTAAALCGAMIPDLSLYIMGGVAMYILQYDPEYVFNTLYFSDAWQQVFAVDNSFVLWGILLGLALWQRVDWLVALCAAALLHIALDFPLHNEDARMHFWPITDWKFHSPVSYWNSAQGANWIGPLEMVIVLVLSVWAMIRFPQIWVRITIFVLMLLQLIPFLMWYFYF